MSAAWVDRAVFYVAEATLDRSLDELLRLGFNAVCVPASMHDLDALIRRAHEGDLRVCVIATESRSTEGHNAAKSDIQAWLARGADGVLGEQLTVGAGSVLRLRSRLFHDSGRPCYFDGHGDFAPFWRTFEAAWHPTRVRLGLFASEDQAPSLGEGREPADVEVAFAFLLTFPVVPFVRAGDERGVEPALERLTYVRLTEPDLAPSAPLEMLSAPTPGYPLVFRRGSSIVVALNASTSAHQVVLPAVGDATPIAARHCHLVHADGRWCARLAPAGYGIFGVT